MIGSVRLRRDCRGILSLGWIQIVGAGIVGLLVPGGRVQAEPGVGFAKMEAAITGVAFTNALPVAAAARNRILAGGSGVALGDVDGDGRTDLYFCRLLGSNALYLNRGDWRFEESPMAGGAPCGEQASTGVVMADVEGDGDLDLLVSGIGAGCRLFLNDGQGHFQEKVDSGLHGKGGATSMALADMDGDGDLDLYVAYYREDSSRDAPPGIEAKVVRGSKGEYVATPRERFVALAGPASVSLVELGEADILYRNLGGARFERVSWTNGFFRDASGTVLADPPRDWGLSVMFRDIDGDGWPDLYVCNDFVHSPDRFWRNLRGRGFQEAGSLTFRSQSLASMAVDVADVNRDGYDDLFVGEMLSRSMEERAWQRPENLLGKFPWPVKDPRFRPEVSRSTLQMARGDGTFAEVAAWAGVAATEWTWSAGFLDVDMDGWEDLLVATGSQHDLLHADVLASVRGVPQGASMEQRAAALGRFPELPRPKLAFHNQKDGTFRESGHAWGFSDVGVAHGMAWGDLDGDGDLDLAINQLNSAAGIYRNIGTAKSVLVSLSGPAPNTRGIGSRVTVLGGPVRQSQVIQAGGRYCSHAETALAFACGQAPTVSIHVRWPDGKESLVTNVPSGARIVVKGETRQPNASPGDPSPIPPWFRDVSAKVNHTHEDQPFPDFQRQPLLPLRLASLGPSVIAADLEMDGTDDILVGGGTGGSWTRIRTALGGGGEWHPATEVLRSGLPRDQHGMALWREGRHWRVAEALSTWEDSSFIVPIATVRDPLGTWVSDLATHPATTGPVAAADIDGDGDVDFFTGFISQPERWPEVPSSIVHRRDAAGHVGVSLPGPALPVMGAVFTDLDADGLPELVTACDWGGIRIYRCRGGAWMDATRDWGLEGIEGWWRGITAGDFDGDGRMDLVAGNWGLNGGMGTGNPQPMRWELRHADWMHDGTVQTLVGGWSEALNDMVPVRERRAVVGVLPLAAGLVPDHRAMGRISLARLATSLGPHRTLTVRETRSMVFLNRGRHLEPRPLPFEAQWSTAMGVSVADFDGNGTEDLFLSQNFFGTDPETSRQDAGFGLLLLGDGSGGFRGVGPRASGMVIEGEGRGCAVGDFNGDRRPDVAVAQHRGSTRVFLNERGKQGLRVRLMGPPGNECGIGAVLRLGWGATWGPAREIHAGSGWWSQDTCTPILATVERPEKLQVRWPGGKVTLHVIAPGSASVEASFASP